MGDLFSNLHWIAVIVAALAYFVLGWLWYSLLFTNKWMELRGLSKEEMDDPNPVIFLYSFILQFIAVLSLALFIDALGITGAGNGAFIGFAAGAGFVFTLAGSTGIFSDTKLGLHFIDNGYHVTGLIIAGAILGAW